MRPLIFVRRSQVASAFLINDPVELAKMNRVKRDFGKKGPASFAPRLSS
jgi:pseudouridine-5'-phosphate glycosidase